MQRFEQLWAQAPALYANGDPGHDFAHIRRVVNACRQLGVAEGARLELLLAAAALHDVVNVPKNSPDRARASELAAARAAELLPEFGFSAEETATIGTIIVEHSFSLGRKPSTIESAILQDADRLDAIGAIGVMRCVSTGVAMGAAYYHAEDPFAERRAWDDRAFSLDHFFVKLLQLRETMNTAAGRAEAERRTAFLRAFVRQLASEIGATVPASDLLADTRA